MDGVITVHIIMIIILVGVLALAGDILIITVAGILHIITTIIPDTMDIMGITHTGLAIVMVIGTDIILQDIILTRHAGMAEYQTGLHSHIVVVTRTMYCTITDRDLIQVNRA